VNVLVSVQFMHQGAAGRYPHQVLKQGEISGVEHEDWHSQCSRLDYRLQVLGGELLNNTWSVSV
jgi:hypothetical protein